MSDNEIKLKGLQKAMAKQMTLSWEAPQCRIFTRINCEAMIAYRKNLGFKTSYTTILAKVVSDLLTEYPMLNCSFDPEMKAIVHEEVNMGIAVDSKRGLVVPVIPDAANKSLEEIHEYMEAYKEKSKTGMFSMEDLTGGTFVISNLGMFNVTSFSAIVNVPNAAIMSVAKMEDTPVLRDGVFVPEKTMVVGLSLDHRVTDGATGAKFMTALADRLENLK